MDVNQARTMLEAISEADWVTEMQAFYDKNGDYRVEDLRRLLGDPCQGVSFSTREDNLKNLYRKLS